MIEFDYVWLFACLPLPLIVYWLLPAHREFKASIRVPFFQTLVELSGRKPGSGAVVLQRLMSQRVVLGVAWLLIVTALAKPSWVGDPVTQVKSARDLMVAVDISGSMDTADWSLEDGTRVSRLDGVKRVLATFAARREHDRLGLIVFGDNPFLQVPFTPDLEVFETLLDETQVGMAGQSTRFGDAVGLAIKLFEDSQTDNRVLIVLTDGNDTGSRVPPVEAAKIAADRRVRIYNIAIGDPATSGEQALDLDTLATMTRITGGATYRAFDAGELDAIYGQIGELEPDEYETLSYRPRRSLHWVPLAVTCCLYTGFFSVLTVLSIRQRRSSRTPADA